MALTQGTAYLPIVLGGAPLAYGPLFICVCASVTGSTLVPLNELGAGVSQPNNDDSTWIAVDNSAAVPTFNGLTVGDLIIWAGNTYVIGLIFHFNAGADAVFQLIPIGSTNGGFGPNWVVNLTAASGVEKLGTYPL